MTNPFSPPTPWLREIVCRQLERLGLAAGVDAAGRQRLHHLLETLAGDALDRPACPPFHGLSAINASGLPLQWSVSTGGPVRSVRFLCEGGPLGSSAQERLASSWRRLESVGPAEAIAIVRRAAELHLLPAEWPNHWRSAMWSAVGAAAGQIGFKAYFNLTDGPPIDRWRRVGHLLQALGRPVGLEHLCRYSGLVSRQSFPVGVAIGIGTAHRAGSVKIYFRSGDVDAAWIARWYSVGAYPGGAEALRLLLETFAPPAANGYSPGSFIASLEFPESDLPPALKIEVEVTRWADQEADVVLRTRRLLSGLSLPEDGYLAALEALAANPAAPTVHRIVGVKLESSGATRVNIYIEPPLPAARPRSRKPPGLRAAAAWLNRARTGGSWEDYRLPVGSARHWVTAYTSFALSPDLAASGWLQSHFGNLGWGYNATTPDDADSTALAILALRRAGCPVPPAAEEFLLTCFQPEGGVATYAQGTPPGGAWSGAVADVTPVAVEALGLPPSSVLWCAALDWLLRTQRPDGLWNAYWWSTPLYPTWWVARVFGPHLPKEARGLLESGLRAWRPAGAFEVGLHALTWIALGDQNSAASPLAALLAMQNPDGSWPPSALLRLSKPSEFRPWSTIDSGACYLDEQSIFTTATAHLALASGRLSFSETLS